MDGLDKLTVCVTTYNEEKNIEQCIEGIRANGVEYGNILIVDASKDRTAELIEKVGGGSIELIVVDEKDRGRAAQKAVAVQKCKTKYMAIVDADDVLDKECLSKLLRQMQKKGWVAIKAQTRAYSPRTYWERGWDACSHYAINKPGLTNMVGRPCIHTIESLRKIGGFDDRVDTHDDTTTSIRLEAAGYKQGIGTGVTYRKFPDTYAECKDHWVRYGIDDAKTLIYYPEKKKNIYRHLLYVYPVERSLILLKYGQLKYIPFTILSGLIRFNSMRKTLKKGIF